MGKQEIMREVREELLDVQREREELRQCRLEEESIWNKAYEEAWRREYL